MQKKYISQMVLASGLRRILKKFTPELKCTNPVLGAGSIKTIQTVDIYDRFILYEKNERFGEYQFEFYNYKDSQHSPIYTVNRKTINRKLYSAFYSENYIFCLERSINSETDFYITKRTVDSPEVVLEYKLDKSSFKVSCTGPMYVDEKNDRFLCQCSKYRKDGRLEYFLKIMSLSTGKELFFYRIKLFKGSFRRRRESVSTCSK